MTSTAFSLAMLRSAVTVLSEAAGEAEAAGLLDPFYQGELPLARQDIEDAMDALERALREAPREAA